MFNKIKTRKEFKKKSFYSSSSILWNIENIKSRIETVQPSVTIHTENRLKAETYLDYYNWQQTYKELPKLFIFQIVKCQQR
jgi:hypothetical protein